MLSVATPFLKNDNHVSIIMFLYDTICEFAHIMFTVQNTQHTNAHCSKERQRGIILFRVTLNE